jgi:acyl-CoA thioester hydrolase
VTTTISKIGTSSFTLKYSVYNQKNGVLVAEGEVVLVNYDREQQKSKPLDPALIRELQKYIQD